MDGILNVYKEQGYTSFDVVAKLRGILKQKKIGHTGTLDPMAEGVLMICLGKATKLVDMLTAGTKEYRAVMRLGIMTDTEDITGTVLENKDIPDSLTKQQIESAVLSFVGEYNQIPPMYSAIKKDGKKLYEYARQGTVIDREPRHVEIFSITNIDVRLPEVAFDVYCSKGTYIRSLCRDIGESLNIGACMSGLVRSQVHGYRIEDSLKLSEIEALRDSCELKEHIMPIDALLQEYPVKHIKDIGEKKLMNGNKLPISFFEETNGAVKAGQLIRVYCKDEFIALYRYDANEKIYKPYKMFLS